MSSRDAETSVSIALSVGCPCGIGPEVSVGAAWKLVGEDPTVHVELFGDAGAIENAANLLRVPLGESPRIAVCEVSRLDPADREAGRPGVSAGRAQLAAIDRATDAVMARRFDALVTGPVSKHAISSGGTSFLGHTEYLQRRTGAACSVMMFAGPRLRTSLVTTHLALRDVATALTRQRVGQVATLTARSLRTHFGIETPRVLVAALNPHAGESGMLGREEIDVIAPAVRDAALECAGDAKIAGPIGAETAFREARDGRWDAVVAMYHDQATIPSKLLDFGEAVNVTLGLPIVRTSVDHGTGYDIAGRGTADAAGMLCALRLATAMARRASTRA